MIDLPYMIISYYTMNTPYGIEIGKLEDSLKEFDLPYRIYGVPSRGSWIKNVQINEEIILQAMNDFPDKAIVSLDADSVVQRYPALFETIDCDFAAHDHIWERGKRRELFCSTMYFRNCDLTKKFLNDCLLRYERHPTTRQQPNMMSVFDSKWTAGMRETWRQKLRFVNLPPQYCKIFDLMGEIKYPVIEQFQASRRFKKLV